VVTLYLDQVGNNNNDIVNQETKVNVIFYVTLDSLYHIAEKEIIPFIEGNKDNYKKLLDFIR